MLRKKHVIGTGVCSAIRLNYCKTKSCPSPSPPPQKKRKTCLYVPPQEARRELAVPRFFRIFLSSCSSSSSFFFSITSTTSAVSWTLSCQGLVLLRISTAGKLKAGLMLSSGVPNWNKFGLMQHQPMGHRSKVWILHLHIFRKFTCTAKTVG